ncbi:MAG: hypothetical protein FJ276_35055 [Planctomycetes bacterium]|nr:hypothetical protein [Planctomycetota bacterium]
MRTGNLIEVEYAYDSPVIGKMTYRGTLPQDKSFAGDLPVIAESDHFRFRSRDSRAYGKETLRELERAYSWLAENYAGAVRPDKSSHFEVGLWSGVGGAVAAGDTFGLDVYSAGKLVPNTCPEHGMGMLFNVFGHCYKAKFPYYHAREMGSGASQASLIAAYCLRANQGDRVFRQCRQLWSTRFFEHLLGRVSDSGFPDFDRHTFILFYLDARYGLHINRDFFRAVYADEGNCAQLLATMDFLANDHERTAAVYSFLVGENLAWLYRWARLPVAEASIDEAVIRFQELKATPPPPWPATR